MSMHYLFAMNGAGLKMHDSQEDALRQARQWKNNNFDKRIVVEEHEYTGFDHGYRRTHNDVAVELPMLVPSLTPRWDWDDAPYGAT